MKKCDKASYKFLSFLPYFTYEECIYIFTFKKSKNKNLKFATTNQEVEWNTWIFTFEIKAQKYSRFTDGGSVPSILCRRCLTPVIM